MSHKGNDMYEENKFDYFTDNPSIVCKCGRKFRKHAIDKNGVRREYTQCMNCTIDDWNKKHFK